MIVRCIDNILQRDVLTEGKTYEVIKVEDRDGYYVLSGLGRFSMARFEVVTADEGERADHHLLSDR